MNYWIEDIEHTSTITIKVLHYESDDVTEIDSSIFTKQELSKFNTYKSLKRRREFFFTRLLWKAFHHPDTIIYRATGKPTLEKGFLSISHSHKSIAIGYSPVQELGIDIEPISNKIKRVRHKFMHANEKWTDLVDITKAWCIKEAVYKLMDMDDVFFMDNIILYSLENHAQAEIDVEGIEIKPKFIVKQLENDMMMAWAVIK